MKKVLLTLVFSISLSIVMAQTTHVISAVNLNYVPDSIVVAVGDTVEFIAGSSHPTLEVDQATWQANGTTPLSGGFDIPSGDGKVYISSAKTYYYVCTNHVGDGMKGRIFANQIGIDETEKQLVEIEIFPNPVGEMLHFSLNQNGDLQSALIFDLSGKMVKQLDLTRSSDDVRSYDISELKAGSYILRIENGNTAKEMKFVKK